MYLATGADINISAILENFKKLTNQIYKLLPNREENIDWETPLSTVIEEYYFLYYVNYKDYMI